jgi:Tfp pilus assembly protein PilV
MTHEGGFTIVEVLTAVVVLTVGLLGLASTAGYVTRMTGQGNRYTIAATLAGRRLEMLRADGCSGMAGGSSAMGRFTVSWTVTTLNTGSQRTAKQVQVMVTSPTTDGTRSDSLTGTILC